jgi:uncharacterized membrane protein YsdA (DUF1294 family)
MIMETEQIIFIYLVVINVVTFFTYGIDKWKAASKRELSKTRFKSAEREQFRPKAKARRSKWRIPEATLLGLAVIGGSFGAWLGMKVWHHKTKHKKFQYGIPLILIAQMAIILLLYRSSGFIDVAELERKINQLEDVCDL